MLDLFYRSGPRVQSLRFGYEKGGLAIHEEAIPWCAESVLVEANLTRVPADCPRHHFRLRWPGQSVPPVELSKAEADRGVRLLFRLPTLSGSVSAELRWQNQSLGQLSLPILRRDEFIRQLRLSLPAVFVNLGETSVACQTFVSTQCRGLTATAVLTSPTSLAPVADLGLQVEFQAERSASGDAVAVMLTGPQRAGRQALVSAVAPKPPRRVGSWLVTWRLGELVLACQRVRAISAKQFQRSLRVADTRFVVQAGKGPVALQRALPQPEACSRVGPCFILTSHEAGMAGLCPVSVYLRLRNSEPRLLREETVLLCDGPTPIMPGTVSAGELPLARGFELRIKDSVAGLLSLDPAPTATFTSEGGFQLTEAYFWTSAAEHELSERLGRLTQGR